MRTFLGDVSGRCTKEDRMKPRGRGRATGLVVALALTLAAGSRIAAQVQAPQPGVPEIFTIQGEFVRVAYNNEGYVSLGYRTANQSAGEEWMLLEVGITVRKGVEHYLLKRGAVSLETPDGKTIPLASIKEYQSAGLMGLERRADTVRDSINYFPPDANRACAIVFFAQIDQRAMPREQVDLSYQRACVGRLFFKVPGGIQYGQHWLNVQFENSLVRAPFRILTKEEEKEFSKSWKNIKKELDKAWANAAKKQKS